MDEAISIDNESKDKSQRILDLCDNNTLKRNTEVLFYIKGVYHDDFQIQDYYQGLEKQKTTASRISENAFNSTKAENTEITKETFRKIITDISSILETLFKKENRDPKPQPPFSFENDHTVEGFTLDEIEVNFNIEAGFKLLLEAKANSGITLKFKRK